MIADIPPLLTDQEIYDKICQLYVDKPNFITHVIISSFPICKLKRVESFFKSELHNRMCCLSNQRLTDIYHVAVYQQKQQQTRVNLKMLQENLMDIRTPIQMIESTHPNRKVALIGKNTNRMVCLQAYNQLVKFIADRLNEGDSNIFRIVLKSLNDAYNTECHKRFDLSISWYQLSKEYKQNFINFIAERIPPCIKLNCAYLWELMGGRKSQNYATVSKTSNPSRS